MRSRFWVVLGVCASVSIAVFVVLGPEEAAGQQAAAYRAPRMSDGKPNLNGVWQALNEANWDIEAHGGGPSPIPALLGAMFAEPPGLGVVEGGPLPYKP